MSKMNLKLLIYTARLKGVPVYCIFLLVVFSVVSYLTNQGVDYIPRHLRKYSKFSEDYKVPWPKLNPMELKALTDTVGVLNYEREVFNQKRYGAVHDDTTMLVVQVHRDAERLQYLIVSLAQVHHIQTTVVIFSHSFFDESINKLIMSITFCRFMQIFYPFSIQLYPDKFPGRDPQDCLQSSHKFCSSRDASRTERKHHWWWQANFIFNYLDWSSKYKGTVIFLEEDNYVLPDLLYMFRYAKSAQSTISGIDVMAFGRHFTKNLDYDILIVDTWRPPFDIGLAFNKTTWKKIVALSSYFCMYDDLSWSYSLLHVFSKYRTAHTNMLASMAPRVLSTSTYVSGKDALEKIFWNVKGAPFFPANVKAAMVYSSTGRLDSGFRPPSRGKGGWSDIRDHLLCLNPFSLMKPTLAESENNTSVTIM